jgi:S-adenosylmethionine/arginine decarboxylase-like enzyme
MLTFACIRSNDRGGDVSPTFFSLIRMGGYMRHLHLFVRARVLDPLRTPDRADDFMRRAVAAAGMNVIGGPLSVLGVIPGNEGVSSTAILDFSSANIHEWPDNDPALIHFDLYTCGEAPEIARFKELFAELTPVSFDAGIVDRDRMFDTRPDRAAWHPHFELGGFQMTGIPIDAQGRFLGPGRIG